MPSTVRARPRNPSETRFPTGTAPAQLALNFDLSLLEQHETIMDAMRFAADTCGKLRKAIAMEMDLSKSQLSRLLADNADSDPGHAFPLQLLPRFVEVTGSTMPIQWLALKYMQDPGMREARVLDTVTAATRALERALVIMGQQRQ